MDAQKNKSTNIRRGKRRPEQKPKNLTTGKQSTQPAIWKTIEDAKRKQGSIRNRVRKYGDEEGDSDYGDSESDSDEYDDDFDLSTPLEVDTRVPQKVFRPTTGSFQPTRKTSFTNATHSRRLMYHTDERDGSSTSFTSVSSHTLQQSREKFLNPTQKYPLQSRKEEDLPALTPEEAIKLVMQRNSYISDSERTEDAHPILFRKSSVSTSTCETANNTVGSDSGHNRTSEGKRVLVLKKKKYREDTHPRTSKIRSYHQRNPQEPPRRPSRQQQNDANPLIHYKKDIFRPRESSTPIHRRSANEENIKPSQYEQNQREEDQATRYRDKEFGGRNDGAGAIGNARVENNGHGDRIRKSAETQPKASNDHNAKAREHEKKVSTLDKEDLTEKDIIVISESDYCSDSETGRTDDDCWGGHEDDTQRPSNRSSMVGASNIAILSENESMLKALEDNDDDIDSLAGEEDWRNNGEEEDWRNMSWKTAKTSRSVLSKYSKSSSVALWMKNMGEADSGNVDQDDDIFFFDAIQEAGQTSSSQSGSTSDKDDSIEDAMGVGEDDGWMGNLTNLVGYTIGALTSVNSKEDDSKGENDEVGATLVDPRRQQFSTRKINPPSSDATKKVPSRELEIIRKCQELMTSQRVLVEAREKESARRSIEDIRLQRQEEEARARVFREVMAYREMMETMGKGAKLAPLNSKAAAQEYDDRLAMVKTLEDQEKKMRMHERKMMEMEMGVNQSNKKTCCCSCTIS